MRKSIIKNNNLEEIIKRINETLGNKDLQRAIAQVILKGAKEHERIRKNCENKPIQSYISSKGIERAEKIGNEICNNKLFEKFGISVDVFSASNIPIMYLNDIVITIKSLKKPESIIKNKTGYIRNFSKLNRIIDPQIDMFDFLDEPIDDEILKSKYYCILLYHISEANSIEYMQFAFLNEKANEVLFKVDVDKDVFNLEEKITHSDRVTVTEEQVKGKSLKGLVKIK